MLSSDDVRSARFTATKFREGYEIPEVDQVLEGAADTLAHLERGETAKADGTPLLTPNDLLAARFTSTRLREGYDVVEVDDLLDEIITTLNTYIARAQRGEPLTPPSAHETSDAATELVEATPAETAPAESVDVQAAPEPAVSAAPEPAAAADVEPLPKPAEPLRAEPLQDSPLQDEAPQPEPAQPVEPEPAAGDPAPEPLPWAPIPAYDTPATASHAPTPEPQPEPQDQREAENLDAAPAATRAEARAELRDEVRDEAPGDSSPRLPWGTSLADVAAEHSDAFVPRWAPTGVSDLDTAPSVPAEDDRSGEPSTEDVPADLASAQASTTPLDADDAPAAAEAPDASASPADADLPDGQSTDASADTSATTAWSAPPSEPWTPPAASRWTATTSAERAAEHADALGGGLGDDRAEELPAPDVANQAAEPEQTTVPAPFLGSLDIEPAAPWAPITAFEDLTPAPGAAASPAAPAPAAPEVPTAVEPTPDTPATPETTALPHEAEPEAAAPQSPALSASAPQAVPAGSGLDSQAFLRQLTYARATSIGAAKEKLTFVTADGTEVQALRVSKSPTGLVVELG